MVFFAISCSNESSLEVVDGQVWRPKMVVNTDPQLMHLLETGKGTEEWMHVYYFFIVLAACNTVVPQVSETSEQTVKLIEYQGESPDEQALVYAAAAYGFVLIERSSGHIVIDVLGERQRYAFHVLVVRLFYFSLHANVPLFTICLFWIANAFFFLANGQDNL